MNQTSMLCVIVCDDCDCVVMVLVLVIVIVVMCMLVMKLVLHICVGDHSSVSHHADHQTYDLIWADLVPSPS